MLSSWDNPPHAVAPEGDNERSATMRSLKTILFLTLAACGATPTGDDDVTTTDAGIDSPPLTIDSGVAVCATERSMGAPAQFGCGRTTGPGPNGTVIVTPTITTLEFGPYPDDQTKCAVRSTTFGWRIWDPAMFFIATASLSDRFYFTPDGPEVQPSDRRWYGCFKQPTTP